MSVAPLEHDAGADVLEDAAPLEHDGGADVVDERQPFDAAATADVVDELELDADAPCTPLAFPLPLPPTCVWWQVPPSMLGQVWCRQAFSTPAGYCGECAVPGAAACERCAELYTCACLAPLAPSMHCRDTDAGPLLE